MSHADSALVGFYAASIIAVIPLSSLSDRTSTRKDMLLTILLIAEISMGILPIADGLAIWPLVISVGTFIDAFMAIIISMIQEARGIGPEYAGTAIGLCLTIGNFGSFIAPLIGNSLASISLGTPFIFWAALSAISFIILVFTEQTGEKSLKSIRGDLTIRRHKIYH